MGRNVKKEILEPASAVEEIKQDKDIRATWDSQKKVHNRGE